MDLVEPESTSEKVKLEEFLDDDQIVYLSKQIIPSTREKYNYLFLDSANCYEIPSDRDSFTWLINDKIPIYQKGYINLSSIMRNIKMLRIGRLTVAHVLLSQYSTFNTARIGIGFKEFESQAIVLPNAVRVHHIVNKLSDDLNIGNTIVLSAFNGNRGWFRFQKKFLTLDHLTLNMWDLQTSLKLTIPDTYATVSALQYKGNITPIGGVTIVNPIIIADHYMIPVQDLSSSFTGISTFDGFTVEILNFSGFTTDDPIADAALIASYNSDHTLTRQWAPYFYPPVDISSANLVNGSTTPVTITFIYKPRFTGTLEIVSEDNSDDEADE